MDLVDRIEVHDVKATLLDRLGIKPKPNKQKYEDMNDKEKEDHDKW